MTWPPWHFLIVAISGWMNREQQQVACRQVDVATVVKALSPIGDAPANEAQARPLAERVRTLSLGPDGSVGKEVASRDNYTIIPRS